MHEFKKCTSGRAHIGCQIFANISFMIAGVVQYRKEIQTFFSEGWRGRLRKVLAASSFCHHSVTSASHRYEVQRATCGASDYQLSLSLYKANVSLLRHSSSCILCGIRNSFIQIHIANSCTCFSCASLIRTMRYNAAGAQPPRAPDRTLGYAILFALPFSPKHIGALRVHELRFCRNLPEFAQFCLLRCRVHLTI